MANQNPWAMATWQQVAKFERLISRYRLLRKPNGAAIAPLPSVEIDGHDGWSVLCPFTGKTFSMLRRHLATEFDMTEQEVRIMFDWPTFRQTAPSYLEEKLIRSM